MEEGKNMYKINITEDNKNFEFICNSRDTRSGFAHDCSLYINDTGKAIAHCYYYNRTWEVYTFQTVCCTALHKVIDEYTERKINIFKSAHNYKRLTKARREDFEKWFSDNDYIKTLRAVYNDLLHKIY